MSTLSLQRSKAVLDKEGYHVWITEHWHSFAKRRVDLFNMCDLIAIRHDMNGVLGVQACGEDLQPHLNKLLGDNLIGKIGMGYTPPNPHLPVWLCHNQFEIWQWLKRGARGERKLWVCRKWQAILSPQGQVSFARVEESQ